MSFYSWKRHKERCIRLGLACSPGSGDRVMTRYTRGSRGSKKSRTKKGKLLGAYIHTRMDFSDNSHFLNSNALSSAPWASSFALALTFDSALTYAGSKVADIACALCWLSSRLRIPLFWVKQNSVSMAKTSTVQRFPVWLAKNLLMNNVLFET